MQGCHRRCLCLPPYVQGTAQAPGWSRNSFTVKTHPGLFPEQMRKNYLIVPFLFTSFPALEKKQICFLQAVVMVMPSDPCSRHKVLVVLGGQARNLLLPLRILLLFQSANPTKQFNLLFFCLFVLIAKIIIIIIKKSELRKAFFIPPPEVLFLSMPQWMKTLMLQRPGEIQPWFKQSHPHLHECAGRVCQPLFA